MNPLYDIALGGLLALTLVLAGAVALLWRQLRAQAVAGRRQQQLWQQHKANEAAYARATETAIGDLKDTVEAMATALANLELKARELGRRHQAVEHTSFKTHRRQGIDDAIAMARHGRTAEDIARQCGLSIGEAELLSRMHHVSTAH